jgi:CPA2 family monovalent cation:H+ antiporter-2
LAIFGDAAHGAILEAAGVARASHLIITLPHSSNRTPLVATARQLNPRCRIFVRARYLRERDELIQAGAQAACFEEAEAAVALTEGVLEDLGVGAPEIAAEVERIRADTSSASVESLTGR